MRRSNPARASQAAPVGTVRPGGRAARVRDAVVAAALAELRESGPALSFPAIARRAGVQKSSLYRRYPTPSRLLVDVALAAADEAIPVPDTGALVSDLVRVLQRAQTFLAGPLGRALLQASIAAESAEEVAALRGYWRARLARLDVIFRRASARGEWPARAPAELVLALVIGGLWFHSLAGPRRTRAQLRDTVVAVLAGVTKEPT